MKAKIETFLKSIEVENLDILDFVNIEHIDMDDPFESIFEIINDAQGFEVEIIYYSNAMEYLKRYDNSLIESLEIASELGYKVEDINSELLASLLASKKVVHEFIEYKDEINEFFNSLIN